MEPNANHLRRFSGNAQRKAFAQGLRQRSSAWDGRPTKHQQRRKAKLDIRKEDY